MGTILQAVLIGMLVMIAGTIPRNLIFAANLRFYPGVPWAVPVTAVYLWLLWPYYVAVAAIYGVVTYRTNSILPAVVLHTCGNLYSNFDLWLHGQAEWQAAPGTAALIWNTGADAPFWIGSLGLLLVTVAMVWAYGRLARATAAERP